MTIGQDVVGSNRLLFLYVYARGWKAFKNKSNKNDRTKLKPSNCHSTAISCINIIICWIYWLARL